MLNIDKTAIKNILVVRFKGLGDILLSVPALRALKKNYPNAHLTVLINKEAKEVLTGLSFIDEILLYDKKLYGGPSGFLRLVLELKRRKFDLTVDLICYPKSALLTFLSGSKYRVGTPARGRSYAYNMKVSAPKEILYAPKVHLLVMKGAGVEDGDLKPEIFIPEQLQKDAEKFLFESGVSGQNAVGLNPFTNFETRSWGISKFAELSDALVKEGNKVVLLWGPGDDTAGFMKIAKEQIMLAPKTDIKQLGALAARLKLVITTNTFTKHITAAVGTPTLTIYGATNPKAWEPEDKRSAYIWAGVDCQPCEKNSCEDLKCIKNISVKEVLEKANLLLKY